MRKKIAMYSVMAGTVILLIVLAVGWFTFIQEWIAWGFFNEKVAKADAEFAETYAAQPLNRARFVVCYELVPGEVKEESVLYRHTFIFRRTFTVANERDGIMTANTEVRYYCVMFDDFKYDEAMVRQCSSSIR